MTPDRSQSKPDIEPKISGAASNSAPCSIPVSGMNLPAAAQSMKAKIKNPDTSPAARAMVLPFLNRKYAQPQSASEIRVKIWAP